MENDKEPMSIPYAIHEGEMARFERTIKRLWILCIIIFIAFAVSNGYWIYRESQFEDISITQEVTQDTSGSGNNTYSGNTLGGSAYGKADC